MVMLLRLESFKYMGTYLDKRLSFNENVDNIFRKATERLFVMQK